MNVTVNGENREIEVGASVLELLQSLGLDAKTTVVQRNDDIVERDHYAETALAEGDALELVRFVGGG